MTSTFPASRNGRCARGGGHHHYHERRHRRRWQQLGRAMMRILAIAGTGCAIACGGCAKKDAEGTSVPAAPPPSVVVAKVDHVDVVPYEIRTGSLSANQYVKILPRVAGFVETVNFQAGKFIDANTVLFTLDSKPFKAKLDEAEANLAVARANLQNAKDELARQERLQAQNATAEKDLLNARNNQRAAVASEEAAKAAVEAAKLNVDYCTISSPIKGKVDVNSVDVGDLVGPTGQKPLTTVAEIDPILVNFTFPEGLIVNYLREHPIQPGKPLSMPVKLSIGTENDFRYDATLDFVSNTLDPATGTIAARATAKNPDLKLFPGLFVRVKVDLSPLKAALLVQQQALGRDIGGDFVWAIKPDNTAEKRYVKLGPVIENKRVVQSGLSPDETYVVQGTQRVRDRGKVTPKSETAASTTAPAEAPAGSTTQASR
jgi:multidrug efflux system membrane fusion protein